jgi:hypothetical protein
MSAPAQLGVTPILFQKNAKFMNGTGATGIQITGSSDPDVLAAVAADRPFPSRQIDLGEISLQASPGKDVQFNGPKGPVSFKGGGSAFARLGVYVTDGNMLQDLGLDDSIAPGDVGFVADNRLHVSSVCFNSNW